MKQMPYSEEATGDAYMYIIYILYIYILFMYINNIYYLCI